MKIYICADIEGVAGVVNVEQTRAGNPEYERARRLMTAEVNAAIEGAMRAGAEEILVNDAHGAMTNLLPEMLDPAARLILGKPKPLNMFEGLNSSYDAVFCIGFHARAGSFGILAHTVNGFAFSDIRVNGISYGEAGLYGAYAGALNVPVALISGDSCCIEENKAFFPEAIFVETKQTLGNRAGNNLPVEQALSDIRDGAFQAVTKAKNLKPFKLEPSFLLELTMTQPALADLTAVIPGCHRVNALTVSFKTETMEDVIRWVNTVSALSSFLR